MRINLGQDVYLIPLGTVTTIRKNVRYKLVDRALIKILEDRKLNVLKDAYIVNGLTETHLKNDKLQDVNILTFTTNGVDLILIPENQVSLDDSEEIEYSEIGIGLNLGALPVGTSLDGLIVELISVVESKVGVTPSFKTSQLSGIRSVDKTTHEELLLIRKNKSVMTDTPAMERHKHNAETTRLNNLVNALKQKVIDLKK